MILILWNNALPQSVQCKKPQRKILSNYFLKAREFSLRNELDSAIYYNKLALNIYSSAKDTSGTVKLLNYIAKIFQKKFEYDSTITYINAALALLPEKKFYQFDKAELYYSLGDLYVSLGDYANAAIYCKRALDIRQETQVDNKAIATSYSDLGDIEFELEHYDKAIYYYQQALQKFLFPKKFNDGKIAYNYDHIGNALLKKNNFTEAKKYFLKGFSYLPLISLYLDLGRVFILEKNFAAADTSLKKALELRLAQYGVKHYLTSQCYSALGDLYKAKKDYSKALEYYTEALNSNIKSNEENFFIFQKRSLNNIISVKEFIISLKGKAEMLLELAKKDSAEARLLYAKKLLIFSVPFLSEIQKYYLFDDSKLKLRESADEIMNLGLETCYEIYKITGDEKYILQGFLFSETKRNSVLNESKAKREAMRELNIPDSLKNAELKLKLKLNQLFTSSEEINNDSAKIISDRENQIISTVKEYDTLLAKIKNFYPKYASLVLSDQKLTLYEIRKNTIDDVVVEYTISKDKIFLFCITKDSVLFIKKEKKHSFDRMVNDYRNSLKKINKETYLSTARGLYNELILPVEKEIINKKKLTIIPCPELASLPFEAFISPKGSYLFEKTSIQYLNSSNYFGKNKKAVTNNYPFYFVGIAPSYDNQKDYAPLKNKEELNDISALLKKYDLRDEIYSGESATKESFYNSINKSKILHIAAHSFADTLNEGKSGIVFGTNVLTAAEIIANEFNTDLVVLSSCEGGNGRTASGEGVLSLARNFIRAGAKNALVALWKVSDNHTKLFMMEFYKQLVKDNNYAEALCRTKREVIKNKLFAFPNTWAAFVLMR
ncbi:MAG: CHAT domain-containing protein [Methanococcaceae archaeon]